jgi:hypothetical protein
MRYQGAFLFLVVLIALGGCGSNDKAVNDLSREQAQMREQVRSEMAELSNDLESLRLEVRNLGEWLRDVNGDLVDVQTSVSQLSEQRVLADAARANATNAGAAGASGAGTGPETVELVGADLDTVARELAKTRQQVADLRKEYDKEKELEALRDPRQAWEAMGNAEMLLARIDRFAEAQAATIEDVAQRDQFLADVKALRQEIDTRAKMTPEQQADYYRTRITDLLNAETDDRRRQWYERQLETLNNADEEVVTAQLDRAVRMDNARAVGELASRYEVSGDTLRDNGLISFGGRGNFGGPGGAAGGRGGAGGGGGRGGTGGGGRGGRGGGG